MLEHVFHSDAYPNVGDIFYVGGYPFIAIGLVMLLRITRHVARRRRGDRRLHRCHQRRCAVVGVLRRATAFDNSLPLFERLISVAYPAGDLLLIAIGAQLAVRQVRRQAPYWILAVGLLALLVADLGYLYQSLYGVYNERDPIDFGWWISYALIVAVLLHPQRRRNRRRAEPVDTEPVAASHSVCCRS